MFKCKLDWIKISTRFKSYAMKLYLLPFFIECEARPIETIPNLKNVTMAIRISDDVIMRKSVVNRVSSRVDWRTEQGTWLTSNPRVDHASCRCCRVPVDTNTCGRVDTWRHTCVKTWCVLCRCHGIVHSIDCSPLGTASWKTKISSKAYFTSDSWQWLPCSL